MITNITVLYIFWFLHQTTTFRCVFLFFRGCISFDSYIKPQPRDEWACKLAGCISFDSYIKPQPSSLSKIILHVVYLLIPTSNHNKNEILCKYRKLYIFWFLHQTTTYRLFCLWRWWLYIFWFLHQTTTYSSVRLFACCCISFDSYIKPQRVNVCQMICNVVYLLIPTSNHNYCRFWRCSFSLYIFWFLHQTTTFRTRNPASKRCISFDSYIKPQLYYDILQYVSVVYLLIPTSNHNWTCNIDYLTPLYIFWFLHQTTTE